MGSQLQVNAVTEGERNVLHNAAAANLITREETFVKRIMLLLLASMAGLSAYAGDTSKPVVLIAGDGNLTVTSTGTVVGGSMWATGVGQSTVSKHNQTMEMAQVLLESCPTFEITLDRTVTPDYYLVLNRVGGAYNIGQSQIMALNRRKVVLFVGKKGTVKNAVKHGCNAMMADWQTTGRLAVTTPDPPPPAAGQPGSSSPTAPAEGQRPPTVEPNAVSKKPTVALEMLMTARGQKYHKPETIANVMSDTTAYLTAKGVSIGSIGESSYRLTLIIDRPISKWIKLTVQMRNADNMLWNEVISDGGWTHLGGSAMLNALEKLHQIIDARLGEKNGLPVAVSANESAQQ